MLTIIYVMSVLDLTGYNLTEIPRNMPYYLTEFIAVDNNIKIIENLPDDLLILNIGINKIKKIPTDLPKKLIELSLYDNEIAEIPTTLPDSIKLLDLENNHISNLSIKLPSSLEQLDIGFNFSITNIPLRLKYIKKIYVNGVININFHSDIKTNLFYKP